MACRLTRRGFLKGVSLAGGAFLTARSGGLLKAGAAEPKLYKTQLHKSFICGGADSEIFKAHAEAGFEGVELTNRSQTDEQIKADLKLAAEYGLRVHSMMGGGADFNSEDPAVRAAGLDKIRAAIRAASLYGADTLLLVPGRIGGSGERPIPNPGELKIEFDPETIQITRVAGADNAPFQKYMDEHNRAAALIFDEVEKLIPCAAYYGVIIAIENVWNNLWLQPEIFSAYIRKFDDLWVKAYYDMGNHAKYAPTSRWLRLLGKEQIAKLHLKDFAVEEGNPNTMGEGFCPFGTGTIDWSEVRGTIEEIGYNGWVTYEEECHTDYTPADYGRMMDRWFAGQPIFG